MEKNTSNYLKYAIGEIVLVVIGILIALQANNWNIERNNSKQEKNILLQLEDEYLENLKEVEQKILLRNSSNSSIIKLIAYGEIGIQGISLDTIRKHITQTYLNITFDGASGVTSVLLNSGSLNLLKNQELKNHLSNWSGTSEKMIEEEQFIVKNTLPAYFDYIRHHFDMMKMMSDQPRNFEVNTSYLKSNKAFDYSGGIRGRYDKKEFSKFLNDMVVSNFIITIHHRNRTTNNQAEALKTKIEQILEIIRQELKKKN
jgi:hypothetical protein